MLLLGLLGPTRRRGGLRRRRCVFLCKLWWYERRGAGGLAGGFHLCDFGREPNSGGGSSLRRHASMPWLRGRRDRPRRQLHGPLLLAPGSRGRGWFLHALEDIGHWEGTGVLRVPRFRSTTLGRALVSTWRLRAGACVEVPCGHRRLQANPCSALSHWALLSLLRSQLRKRAGSSQRAALCSFEDERCLQDSDRASADDDR
mmetsp:Transcript_89998/g.201185  ORF Transcript_89998/g.201185 Transcript_89998/m.201185 type:complete len:201 (-) Transcript_89998:535-1137(-)